MSRKGLDTCLKRDVTHVQKGTWHISRKGCDECPERDMTFPVKDVTHVTSPPQCYCSSMCKT